MITRESIIAANPHLTYRDARIGRRNGLIGLDAAGAETWIVWEGDFMVCAAGPWDEPTIAAVVYNLEGAQPGKRFATAGEDQLASRLAKSGIKTRRDPDGRMRLVIGNHRQGEATP
jgi:hypothetical protein